MRSHLDNAPAREGQMELDRVEVRSSLASCPVQCKCATYVTYDIYIAPKKSDREDPYRAPGQRTRQNMLCFFLFLCAKQLALDSLDRLVRGGDPQACAASRQKSLDHGRGRRPTVPPRTRGVFIRARGRGSEGPGDMLRGMPGPRGWS